VEFISTLTRRHPDTFLNIPSFYFPCRAEDLPYHKEVDSKRTAPAIYVDFFTCPGVLAKQKVFQCPIAAPPSGRYEVHPKQWSELSYEVSRGELRMESYLSFLRDIASSGGVIVNLFGGLKPIAAALVSYLQHKLALYSIVLALFVF
jgi:hypothetical protein